MEDQDSPGGPPVLRAVHRNCHQSVARYRLDMDWQQPVALGVVVVTAGLIVWRWVRPRPWDFHRETGCGCGSSSGSKPPSVLVTGRRGERPRVTVSAR